MTLPPGCVQSYLVLFLRRSPGACKVQEAEAGREQAVTGLVDLACRQRHSNPSVLAGQPKSTAKGETMPVQIKNSWGESSWTNLVKLQKHVLSTWSVGVGVHVQVKVRFRSRQVGSGGSVDDVQCVPSCSPHGFLVRPVRVSSTPTHPSDAVAAHAACALCLTQP